MYFFKKIFFLFVFLLFAGKLSAQFPNPLDFNTATNATNTGTLAIGANDLHWTASLTSSLGPFVPAAVCGNQATCCWLNSPFANANWITYPHTCSASQAEHSCLGNVDEFYKLIVTLPANSCNQSIATPSAYCLSFDFFADNWVSAVYVNNVLSFNNPNGNPYGAMGFTWGGQLTVSLCNNWQVGTNTVLVHVKSGAPSFPGWTGFLAQANQTVNTTVGIPVSASVTQTNVTCFGGTNGSASATASGGNAPFTYTWLPVGGNASVASNLSAGIYSVLVANANGCTATQTLNITQPAPINITVPSNTSICNGGSATITAGGANTYTWSNGFTTPTTIINSTGVYTVIGTNTLTGCTGSNTISIQTGNNPTVIINSPGPVCEGGIITLTASGASTYTWNTGSSGSTVLVSAISNTIYSVTGFDANNVCYNTQTVSVNTLSSPTVSILGNTGICEGNSLTLTANGADTYTWSNSLNSSQILISPAVTTTYAVIGTNTVTGCSNTFTTTVVVGTYPQISVANATACAGYTVALIASGANSYTWSNGANTAEIVVTPFSNTTYTVIGSGALPFCNGTQTAMITVQPAPTLTVTSFPGNNVCAGKAINLVVQGADAYVWSNGSSGAQITVSPFSSTIFTVTGTIFNLSCRASKTIAINVHPVPHVKITSDSLACEGDQGVLKAEGADTYQWSTAQNTASISITVSENDTYYVTGINLSTGCSSTGSIEVIPSNACCEFFIPNSFTPNNDGINEEFGPKTMCKFTDYKLTIFDRWGEKIFESNSPKKHWDGTLKGKACKDDVYVYLIEGVKTGSGFVAKEKYLHLTGHVILLR